MGGAFLASSFLENSPKFPNYIQDGKKLVFSGGGDFLLFFLLNVNVRKRDRGGFSCPYAADI